MTFVNSISPITLNQNEYCFLTSSQWYNSPSFRVRIPKLMSNIPQARTEYFNRNIFVNASTCRPLSATSVTCQDYITVQKSDQCSLYGISDINGFVPKNTRLTCLCMNNNIKDMRIIDTM